MLRKCTSTGCRGAAQGTTPVRTRVSVPCSAARTCKPSSASGARNLPVCKFNAGAPAESSSSPSTPHVRVTDTLAKLVAAQDLGLTARSLCEMGELTEEFFMVANTYLLMAQRDKNADVVSRLEEVVKVAWSTKQATLKPFLQLLNHLVNTTSAAERSQLLTAPGAYEALLADGRAFFTTLDRLQNDVEKQPSAPGKAELLGKLKGIRREATARVLSIDSNPLLSQPSASISAAFAETSTMVDAQAAGGQSREQQGRRPNSRANAKKPRGFAS